MLARATANEIRELIEPIANPVMVLEPHLPSKQMRFFVVNSQAGFMSGYDRDELEGRFLGDVLPQKVARRITGLGWECIASGKAQIYEDVGVLPSGVRSWRGSVSPLVNRDTGAVTRLMLNITDYARETKLLNRYNRFFELSQDLIAVIGPDGYFLELNESWERVLGWSREELQTHPFAHWLHPDDVERSRKEAERVMQGTKAIAFENRYRHRDGSYRWLQWHADSTDDGLLFCIARDITEQKEHVATLRNKALMLEQAEQLAQFGHWRYDLETQTIEMSRQVHRLYGRNPYRQPTESQNNLRAILEAYSPDNRALLEELFNRAIAEQSGFSFETPITLPDNTTRYLAMRSYPERDGTGDMTAMFGVVQDITERREAERELDRQRRFTEQILDALPISVFVRDDMGRFRFLNKAVSDTVGLTKLDVLGRDSFDLFDPKIAERVHTEDENVRLAGIPLVHEQQSDPQTWLLIGKMPIERLDDRPGDPWVLGYALDISQRKRAELELDKQRRFTEQIIDALPMHIYVKDSAGRFRFFNQRASDAVHRDKLGVLGKNDFDIFPEPVATRIRAEDDAVRQQGVSTLHEEHVAGGIWLLMGKHLIEPLDNDNGDAWLLGFSFDISKRKQAELELAAQRDFVQRILDNDPNLIFVKNAEGDFVMANQAVGKLFGVSPEALVNESNYEVHENETDQDVIETGATIQIEETATLPDGTVKTFATTKMPFVRQDGEVQVLAIAVDISERKAYEESLYEAKDAAEAATRAKSAFLATMSHEIRTPLNAVIGMTGLLLDTELNAEQKGYTTAAKHAGEHLLQLINDILDVSKLDAGKVDLEVHPFSLRQEVDTVADMARLTAKRKGLELVTQLSPDLAPYVRGDAARLRQVLLNLVGNAVKFTEAGAVRIEVGRDDDARSGDTQSVHIRVTDSGIGISPDAIDALFDEFSQADSSTTRRFGGTGLGLAISRRLVELMGGEIWVDSKVGQGTTFHVRLPLPVSDVPVDETVGTFDMRTASGPLRILVAEDNHPNQLLIRTLLGKAGHNVDVVGNGLEAVEAVQSIPYDLVLMDVQMPELDGIDATQRIRALGGAVGKIPIVALTAEASSGTREKLLAAGMDDYLTKPIDRKKLARALHQWGHPTEPPTANTPNLPPETALARESSPAAPPSDAPLIDNDTIDELRDILGAEMVVSLFEEFDASLDTVADDFADAHDRADLDQIKRLGHSLKGSAGSLGAQRLSELAATIEQAAHRELGLVTPHLATLATTVSETRDTIRQNITQTVSQSS
ncbi:MAG: PAS domain-containing protein [Trueperaceae bacterium]|nr:PAS domain-containing protein [Trueperaceae bacterium]